MGNYSGTRQPAAANPRTMGLGRPMADARNTGAEVGGGYNPALQNRPVSSAPTPAPFTATAPRPNNSLPFNAPVSPMGTSGGPLLGGSPRPAMQTTGGTGGYVPMSPQVAIETNNPVPAPNQWDKNGSVPMQSMQPPPDWTRDLRAAGVNPLDPVAIMRWRATQPQMNTGGHNYEGTGMGPPPRLPNVVNAVQHGTDPRIAAYNQMMAGGGVGMDPVVRDRIMRERTAALGGVPQKIDEFNRPIYDYVPPHVRPDDTMTPEAQQRMIAMLRQRER